MEFERVITGGRIVDGTGNPARPGSVGIRDGRVAAVTEGERLEGRHVEDAAGCVVTPGFVDVHSHADWVLPLEDHDRILAPLVEQGITTVVAGHCGFSPAPVTDASVPLVRTFSEVLRDRDFLHAWRSVKEFLDTLEGRGTVVNAALLAGHGTVRYATMGTRTGTPTSAELDGMARTVRAALRDGAYGLSAGLAYAPGVFARNDELAHLLRVVRDEAGVFTVHGRAYTWVSPFYRPVVVGAPHNLKSVRELIALAEGARVRLQLSHQIFVGRRTWRTFPGVLREIESAAARGVDVAFDAFPYTCGNSTVNVVFPAWFLQDFGAKIEDRKALRRLRWESRFLLRALGFDFSDIRLMSGIVPELACYEGQDFGAIARDLGRSPFDAYMEVARLSRGKARILLGTYSGDAGFEAPLEAVLRHPLCAFMTDTILTSGGSQNPASFGAYPRILGRYCRERGLFPLEDAVRRMTSYPAERMGLKGVGRIAEGAWADLVVLDPDAVRDNTTPDRPDASPTGVRTVLLSGRVVVRDGRFRTGERRGRVLRR